MEQWDKSGQGELFDAGRRSKQMKPRRPSDWIDRQFVRFHRAHPDVFEQIVKHAHFLRAHGHARYGIAAFFENFRWHRRIPDKPDEVEEYKLNNNYRALYARMLVALHPEFAEFFELRERRSERRRRLSGRSS